MNKRFCFVLVAAAALLTTACGADIPTATSPTPLSALPHQMKGYELYSWQTGSTWNFALITGTNALKTVDQITAAPDTSTDTWVKVSAQGVDGVESQLRRLPTGELVSWIGKQTCEQWNMGAGPLQLPPAGIVDAVTAYCKGLGLNLQVLP